MRFTPARRTPRWREVTGKKSKNSAVDWTQRWLAIGAVGLAIATAGTAAVGLFAVVRSDAANREQQWLTQRGQITDRFTKANDQLSSDKIEGRLGGIYALEQIMIDAPSYEDPIIEILCVYIRNRAAAIPPTTSTPSPQATPTQPPLPKPSIDIQAALTVLSRRPQPRDHRTLDLNGADLRGVDLSHVNLTGADLTGADLTGAILYGTDLTGADLTRANLTQANVINANLSGAKLFRANLPGAHLTNANLTRANLTQANLTNASLTSADLTGANMSGTDLARAYLGAANLTNAFLSFANLTGADLTDTNLTRANLPDADLTGANLTNANLTSANLTGANLTSANLTGVRGYSG